MAPCVQKFGRTRHLILYWCKVSFGSTLGSERIRSDVSDRQIRFPVTGHALRDTLIYMQAVLI